MEINKTNEELDKRIILYIIPRRNDPNLAKKVFHEFQEAIEAMFDIVLLREGLILTSYYYRIAGEARINGIGNVNTLYELQEFVNKLIDYHSYDSVYAELYIIYHKVFTKYMSFDRPRSSISLFLARNIMLSFRDYIRTQSSLFRRMDREVELTDIHKYEEELDYEDDIFNIGSSYYGIEGISNRLQKFMIYLRIRYNRSNKFLSDMTGLPTLEVPEFIKRSINET